MKNVTLFYKSIHLEQDLSQWIYPAWCYTTVSLSTKKTIWTNKKTQLSMKSDKGFVDAKLTFSRFS